jgi:long-subunit fatty acid transport protein
VQARGSSRWIGCALCAGCVLTTVSAYATDAMRFPDNGTQQLARGGAWVARATNPLAALYNPAALATQKSGVLLNANFSFFKECFTREGPGSTLTTPAGVAYPPDVCNKNSGAPALLPTLAGAWRVTDRLGLGYSVSPPSLYGRTSFPETVGAKNGFGVVEQIPSPQRYMLLNLDGVLIDQTFSVGYSILPNLHVGAGFIWGMGKLDVTSTAMALPPNGQPYQDNPTDDVWAQVNVADWFIPGFVAGVLYSPISMVDVGLSVTAQEAFDGHGDLTAKANYWTGNGVAANPSITNTADIQSGLAHFSLNNPLEVKLGVRFHMPRNGAATPSFTASRDPIVDDLFDVEVDASYSRNSQYQNVGLSFPARPVVAINGTGGGTLPQDAAVALNLHDSVGVRLGGDYVLLPGLLALRAGAWFEPSAQDAKDLNVTVVASQRIGLAGGAQVRLGRFDVEVGYLHVFFATQDNNGNGDIRALTGDAANQPTPYRSPYPINGGRLTASANIFSLGGTAHF